jgi:hypothetical protein
VKLATATMALPESANLVAILKVEIGKVNGKLTNLKLKL